MPSPILKGVSTQVSGHWYTLPHLSSGILLQHFGFPSTILPTPSSSISVLFLPNFNILCTIFGLRTPQMNFTTHFLFWKEPASSLPTLLSTTSSVSKNHIDSRMRPSTSPFLSKLVSFQMWHSIRFLISLSVPSVTLLLPQGILYFAKAPNLSTLLLTTPSAFTMKSHYSSQNFYQELEVSSTGERSVFTMRNKSLNLISLSPPPFYLLPVSSFWMFQLLILFPLPLVTLHFLALSPSYENLPKLEGAKLFWNKILDLSSFHFASPLLVNQVLKQLNSWPKFSKYHISSAAIPQLLPQFSYCCSLTPSLCTLLILDFPSQIEKSRLLPISIPILPSSITQNLPKEKMI